MLYYNNLKTAMDVHVRCPTAQCTKLTAKTTLAREGGTSSTLFLHAEDPSEMQLATTASSVLFSNQTHFGHSLDCSWISLQPAPI